MTSSLVFGELSFSLCSAVLLYFKVLDDLILYWYIFRSKHLSYLGMALVTLILSYFCLYLKACTFHPPLPLPEALSVPSLCCLTPRCWCLVAYEVTAIVDVATGVTRL